MAKKTVKEMVQSKNSQRETETESYAVILLKSYKHPFTGYVDRKGKIFPVEGGYMGSRIIGDCFVIPSGNGPDVGVSWKLGVDCVLVKVKRNIKTTVTYTVVEA